MKAAIVTETVTMARMPTFTNIRLVTLQTALDSSRRPNRRQRGLWSVLIGLGCYVGLQAGLNAAIQAEWLPLRDPIYSEKAELLAKHREFYRLSRNSEPSRLLAIGSSRTQLGFDALAMEQATKQRLMAFNFGVPAAGPMTSALYLHRLIESGVRPDYVTIEIHPGFTSDLVPPYESRWLHLYRLRSSEVDRLRGYGWAVESPPQLGWRGWLASAFAYRYAILNRYFPKMMPCPYGLFVGSKMDERGFVAGHDVPAHQKPDALRRTHAEYAPTFVDYRPGGPGVAAIVDMLQLCQLHHIQSAVILMPESSEYRGWYGTDGYRRITAWASSLRETHGVLLVDAREWVPDSGFADGHHLTATGARLYTKQLAERLGLHWFSGAEQ